jgi:hypothetical protein
MSFLGFVVLGVPALIGPGLTRRNDIQPLLLVFIRAIRVIRGQSLCCFAVPLRPLRPWREECSFLFPVSGLVSFVEFDQFAISGNSVVQAQVGGNRDSALGGGDGGLIIPCFRLSCRQRTDE